MIPAARLLLRVLLVGLLLGVAGQAWAQAMPQTRADHYSAFDKGKRPDLVERVQRDGEVAVVVGLRFDPQSVPAAREAPGSAARAAGIAAVQHALEAKMQRFNPQALRKFRHLPYMAMRVNESALDALLAEPGVRSVEIDRHFVPTLIDTPTIVHAVDAWNAGYTGAGQVVAIIDTGVDKTHPFLSGKVVEEACFSTPEYSFLGRSLCPSGATMQTGPGSGAPCVSSADGCYHGTHVAGIAAGHRGILGVDAGGMAPDASLIAVQVFQEICLSGCLLEATTSDLIAALDYVYGLRTTYHIASVNLSLSGGLFDYPCDDETPALTDAITLLRSAGIATVAGAGNDGSPDQLGQPACISTAVSVGSVDKEGNVSYFSNGSVGLSLLAPGEDILSSLPGGGYEYLSGTSMATPHVAGAWAVLKGADPSASVSDVLGALRASGVPVTDPRTNQVTPMIQIAEATGALISTPPTVALTGPAPGTVFVSPADITLTADASDSDGTITLVEFYAGDVKLGEATTPPYTFTWHGIGPGVYTLTARAKDNQFGTAVSAPVTVTVDEGAPWVNFAAQANGGVASASSTYSTDFPATAVNDGDRKGLNWGSGGGWNDGTPDTYPDWVQIQFSGIQSVNEVDVFTVQDAYTVPVEPTQTLTFAQLGITAFEVQYWDGGAWVTVPGGSVSGNNKVWRKFNFSAVNTDRIRVRITDVLGRPRYSRVVEVEAYSSDGAPGI